MKLMKLVLAYKVENAVDILYELLKTRPPEACISHKKMPSVEEHRKFFHTYPYKTWRLIRIDDHPLLTTNNLDNNAAFFVGAIYLSYEDEIGVWCFPEFRGQGHETQAVKMLIEEMTNAEYPFSAKRFVANINPANTAGYAKMYEDLGFKLIQHTYEKTA